MQGKPQYQNHIDIIYGCMFLKFPKLTWVIYYIQTASLKHCSILYLDYSWFIIVQKTILNKHRINVTFIYSKLIYFVASPYNILLCLFTRGNPLNTSHGNPTQTWPAASPSSPTAPPSTSDLAPSNAWLRKGFPKLIYLGWKG